MMIDELMAADPTSTQWHGPYEHLKILLSGPMNYVGGIKENVFGGFFGYFKTKSENIRYWRDA